MSDRVLSLDRRQSFRICIENSDFRSALGVKGGPCVHFSIIGPEQLALFKEVNSSYKNTQEIIFRIECGENTWVVMAALNDTRQSVSIST